MSLLPQLNPPWWLSHQSPAEVSWCSPPPVILSRTAHRTRTHTRHTDPHGTRDTHTEPHGTSTRDTHTMYSSLHIKLSCVCGTVSWFISPMGCGVCMLATSVNDGVVSYGPLGTRHEHADTQANAELTGCLHRDRPRTSSRRPHGLTQLMGHPSDDRHALLARACPGVASMAHAMPWGKCPHTHGRRPCVGSCPRRCPRRVPASVRTELG